MLMATEGFRRAAVWNGGAGEERGERGRRMPTGYLFFTYAYVCICMHTHAAGYKHLPGHHHARP